MSEIKVGDRVKYRAGGKISRLEGVAGKYVTGTVVDVCDEIRDKRTGALIVSRSVTVDPDYRKESDAKFKGMKASVDYEDVELIWNTTPTKRNLPMRKTSTKTVRRTRSAKTEPTFAHKDVLGALARAIGGGVSKDFINDPSEDNIDAILEAARENLMELIETGATKKPRASKVTKKPARVSRKVKDEEEEETSRKTGGRPRHGGRRRTLDDIDAKPARGSSRKVKDEEEVDTDDDTPESIVTWAKTLLKKVKKGGDFHLEDRDDVRFAREIGRELEIPRRGDSRDFLNVATTGVTEIDEDDFQTMAEDLEIDTDADGWEDEAEKGIVTAAVTWFLNQN